MSGFRHKKIKLIYLDNYSTIKVLQRDGGYIDAFHIYRRQSKSYLVSGGHEDIKVWNLDEFSIVHNIENEGVNSFTTLPFHDKLVLAYID